jgi:hypothetical protein
LNIFWQTLLSYIYFYLKLSDDAIAAPLIEAFRHWVFVGINYKNNKPSFNGRFVRNITNEISINFIAYWFLQTHHYHVPVLVGGAANPILRPVAMGAPAPGKITLICNDIRIDSPIVEFTVSQKDCSHFINDVYVKCSAGPGIAIPRPGPKVNDPLKVALNTSINDPTDTNIGSLSNILLIKMAQVLKVDSKKSIFNCY